MALLPIRRGSGQSLSPFNDLSDLFDRFQREFFTPDFYRGEEGTFLPKIEVKETSKSYIVSAELPGMNEKDINITLRENSLVIEGEKEQESKKEEEGLFTSEFSYGSFYRSIPLSKDVDEGKVNATYKDGILTITLDKLAESISKSKKIEIKH